VRFIRRNRRGERTVERRRDIVGAASLCLELHLDVQIPTGIAPQGGVAREQRSGIPEACSVRLTGSSCFEASALKRFRLSASPII
jgi:hypothetical protein